MKKVYHVSLEKVKDGIFTPRIPKTTIKEENDTIPRICFSESIECCLGSMPNGAEVLQMLIEKTRKVNLPALLYVYELDLDSLKRGKDYWMPKKVSKYVPDGFFFSEYWVLKPVKCKYGVIDVKSFEFCKVLLDEKNQIGAKIISNLKYERVTDKKGILNYTLYKEPSKDLKDSSISVLKRGMFYDLMIKAEDLTDLIIEEIYEMFFNLFKDVYLDQTGEALSLSRSNFIEYVDFGL